MRRFALVWSFALVLIGCRTSSGTLPRVVSQNSTRFGSPQIDAVKGRVPVLKQAKIVNFGDTVFEGDLDLNSALDRIRKGTKLKHRNDGAIFGNRERRLPAEEEREYYREFVYEVEKVRFPGPARIVIGKKGDVWFTGDHYVSFKRVNP